VLDFVLAQLGHDTNEPKFETELLEVYQDRLRPMCNLAPAAGGDKLQLLLGRGFLVTHGFGFLRIYWRSDIGGTFMSVVHGLQLLAALATLVAVILEGGVSPKPRKFRHAN
jgi:hypothetical protein